MPFSLKVSKNIKSTTRHLKYSYISIFKCLIVDFMYMSIYIERDIDIDR